MVSTCAVTQVSCDMTGSFKTPQISVRLPCGRARGGGAVISCRALPGWQISEYVVLMRYRGKGGKQRSRRKDGTLLGEGWRIMCYCPKHALPSDIITAQSHPAQPLASPRRALATPVATSQDPEQGLSSRRGSSLSSSFP